MSTIHEGAALSLATTAEPASVPIASEADTIIRLAREGRRTLRPNSRPRQRHLVGRLLALLLDEEKELPPEERLSDIVTELDAHLDRFIKLAAAVGSPSEYRLALRESRNRLPILMLDEGDAQAVGAAPYKALTQIIDMVELTRRDVDRRWIDLHPAWAVRMVSGEFPVEREPERFARVIGADRDRIVKWATGETVPSEDEQARLRLVAQLVYDLRYSHTPHGLLEWFEQPFHELGGRSPLDILADPASDGARALRDFARTLRSQVAT